MMSRVSCSDEPCAQSPLLFEVSSREVDLDLVQAGFSFQIIHRVELSWDVVESYWLRTQRSLMHDLYRWIFKREGEVVKPWWEVDAELSTLSIYLSSAMPEFQALDDFGEDYIHAEVEKFFRSGPHAASFAGDTLFSPIPLQHRIRELIKEDGAFCSRAILAHVCRKGLADAEMALQFVWEHDPRSINQMPKEVWSISDGEIPTRFHKRLKRTHFEMANP